MLTVEDGTGKADANSYATVAELEQFATERNITLPATNGEKEALLLQAKDFMETLDYLGVRYSYEQALAWPRENAVLFGFPLLYSQLPKELKAAQLQLAADAITIPLLRSEAPSGPAVLEEKVEGAVAVKYAAPAAAGASPSLPRAMGLLRPLLRSAWAQPRVRRA